MKPDAERAASDRRGSARAALAAAGLWIALVAGASAGDRALIDFIGYSDDARYFAFEEFGIQDGSGFAYSSVYVVDLATDSWVLGSPVKVQAEDEAEPLWQVRAEAIEQARGFIDDFGLHTPVEIAALTGDGVAAGDGKSLEFGTPPIVGRAVSDSYGLRLSTFETTAATACVEYFGAAPLGFELTLSQGTDRLVHRDASLPRSRGCPSDYRIYAVLMPFGAATLSNAVAIISVYPGGFEGPDRRFLAVPLGF
ncbi:DUF2259 domain-containing protein [Devosia sp. PTR5]|uniref:DUF2259 domain-containing protein n=1 Tax=Devosia oryzisoli TaxID=2774138 RepID=A0A927FX68_9HYPH|nr:DUF2259 domain-containing protein [Devosia oryzisoli]MBD8066294.1 DUF2259 domain-containing protein [Devosia oryzisoli]